MIEGDEQTVPSGSRPHPLEPRDIPSGETTLPPLESRGSAILQTETLDGGHSHRASDDGWHTHDDVPTKIGRLDVRQWLGSGAMGNVFKAHDPQLERMVAVKLVRSGHADEARSRRLQREARALARVSHPNVVQVFDVGLHEGQVFVAMELVDGQTLSAWLEEAPRSIREVLRVFIDAGEGLEAAHAAGVIHRDFKPDNVMIDHRGRARVLDFGLARTGAAPDARNGDAGAKGRPLSREIGPLEGTPAYMAPEQALGRGVDARSDVFAYCVSLWEALFGQRPFEGETILELVWSVSQGERRPPPHGIQVPARLRRVLDRGLQIDPDARWPDMTAMLEALRREAKWSDRLVLLLTTPIVFAAMFIPWLLDEPDDRCSDAGVAIEALWTPEHRTRLEHALSNSSRAIAPQRVTRTLTALDDYAEGWVQSQRELCQAAPGPDPTEADDARMNRRACLDQHLVSLEEVMTLLEESASSSPAVPDAISPIVQALPPLRDCERPDAIASREKQHLEFGLRLARLRTRMMAGRYQEVLGPLTELEADVRVLDAPLLRANVHLALAQTQQGVGQLDAALQSFLTAFDLSVAADTARGTVQAATAVGELLGYHYQRYDEGLAWSRAARPFTERLDELAPQRIAPQQVEADIAFRRGDYPRALELLEQIVSHLRAAFGDDDPRVASYLNDLAVTHSYLGQRDEAARLWRDVVERLTAALGPDHPQLSEPLHNLGLLSLHRKRLDEATQRLERSLAIARSARGEQHPSVAMPLVLLAGIDIRRNMLDRAEARLDRAEAILRGLYDDDNVDLGSLLLKRGELLLARGDVAAALAKFRDGLAIIRAASGEDHPRMAVGLEGLGRSLIASGRPAEAIEPLRGAVELRHRHYEGITAPGEAEWLLARALRGAGHRGEAFETARRARDSLSDHPEANAIIEQIDRWLDESSTKATP